ncbi:MAG: SLC13 family permease, partial [Actinomycetota bacterium]
MGWEAWLTLVVVVATVAILVTERIPPPFAMFGSVVVLLTAGVIDEEQAFAGFSNPAPITVAALYVLAAAVEKTGTLEHITARLLREDKMERGGDRSTLARIVLPTAAASSFLNNTPIVAMVAPAITGWARRTGRPASRFLMPVSFAAILGGVVTVIGTSTNLVVSGLLESSGAEPIGLFEITRVGLPVALVGSLLLILATPRLLPLRRAPSEEYSNEAREFTVEMMVAERGALVGKTVAQGGLRSLEGVLLVEIERNGRRVAPVGPEETLVAGDRLTFAGNVTRVVDLQRMPGLISAEHRHFEVVGEHPGRAFFEVVIGEGSPL